MSLSPRHDPTATADVCLILEGTYPYVRGGVSSWVAQLVTNMPALRFSIVFLGTFDGCYDKPAYPLPPNLVHLEVHPLLGDSEGGETPPPRAQQRMAADVRDLNARLHGCLAERGDAVDLALMRAFAELLAGARPIRMTHLETSRDAWDLVTARYATAPDGLDFNHYFWTVRGMHEPLFRLGRIAREAPPARVYHSVSTGYAGFLGAMLRARSDSTLLISEHGIYTKERELDLAQVDWIPGDRDPFHVGIHDDMHYLRGLWIRFFRSLGQMAYASADRVFTLYEGNRRRQLADGAPEARLEIIPNGVDIDRFRRCRRPAHAPVPPVLALIGRVVPIKDIKCFIRAMRIVRARLPAAEGWIVGPDDEVPGYTEECRRLVTSLELDDTVHFRGFQKPESIFPAIGLSVLTSVSEGQPLVLLEGFAAGIPAVTTDVGSCRELIEGNGDTDRALGAAGLVVPIADPARFASACIELLEDAERWRAAREAAIARVERDYDQGTMIARYEQVYRDAMMQRKAA